MDTSTSFSQECIFSKFVVTTNCLQLSDFTVGKPVITLSPFTA